MLLNSRPFNNIIRQQKKLEWTTEYQKRFEEKQVLTEQIPKTIPDPDQPFCAMCDASNFDIGAALFQSHSGTNKTMFFFQQTQDYLHKLNLDSLPL